MQNLKGDITDLAVSSNNALVASASNDFVIRVVRMPCSVSKCTYFFLLCTSCVTIFIILLLYSGAYLMDSQSQSCGGILEPSLLLHLIPGPALYISYYRETLFFLLLFQCFTSSPVILYLRMMTLFISYFFV